MNLALLRLFQRQVLSQCKFILVSAEQVNAGLKHNDVMYIFCGLQNLLNATANISKELWESGGKKSKERESLRKSIGVSDESPLRDVAMRNNFEHFDERLDRWWADSLRHNYGDMNV